MSSKNEITGDTLISKTNNKAFEEGYERIYGVQEEVLVKHFSKSEKKRLEAQQWVLGEPAASLVEDKEGEN